jgi:hypothetical protein
MTDVAAGPGQRPSLVEFAWQTLVQGTVLLGGILYATGWVFFAIFYAEFDVTPETAGIDFQFILVRTGILLAAGLALIGVLALIVPARVLRAFASGQLRLRNRVFIVAFFIAQVFFAGVLGLGAATWRPWSGLGTPANFLVVALLTIGALVALAVEASLLLVASGYRWRSDEVEVSRPILLLAIIAVALGLVAGLVVVGASRLAEGVRDGHQFSAVGFRVDEVEVTWADPKLREALPSSGGKCATLLGDNDGELVLFFPKVDQTVRVDSELVVVTRKPNGTCREGER